MSTIAFRMRSRRRGGKLRPAWRQPLALTGSVIALGWLVVAIFAPLIAPYDPLAQTFPASQGPTGAHLFGTDELGRDVLSRVIFGSRVSVPIALLLVTLAAVIGGLVGGLAGYFRGIVDGVSMRAVDLVFAFPPIILAMVVTAVLGRGLRNAALAIVVVAWPSYARVVRRDVRREDRDHDPADGDDRPDHCERLPPRRPESAASLPRTQPKSDRAHRTLIRGSMTP